MHDKIAKDAFSNELTPEERIAWRNEGHAMRALWKANWAKFNQYDDLRGLLLDMQTKLIVEASLDPFWGAGCTFTTLTYTNLIAEKVKTKWVDY